MSKDDRPEHIPGPSGRTSRDATPDDVTPPVRLVAPLTLPKMIAPQGESSLRLVFDAARGQKLPVKFLGTAGDAANAARNADTLSRALATLSLSKTGRDILERLTAAGYAIEFDDARTAARGASGLCEASEKKIILKSADDSDALALLLAHEGVHALQAARADDLLPSARHRPETIFRLTFAIEADAYAQQIQVAFELARANPAQPCPLLLMRQRFPSLTRAGDRLLLQDRAALDDGRLCAAVFNAFYDDFSLRSYYETAHVDWLRDFAARRAGAQQRGGAAGTFNEKAAGFAELFRRDMTSARLASLLQWQGRAYVAEHRPETDFAGPRFAGLSAPTRKAVADFYQTYLPGRKMPDLPVFGLYVAAAREEPRPPAGPAAAPPSKTGAGGIRAPRKRKRDFW